MARGAGLGGWADEVQVGCYGEKLPLYSATQRWLLSLATSKATKRWLLALRLDWGSAGSVTGT
jgi:hypothetical protein